MLKNNLYLVAEGDNINIFINELKLFIVALPRLGLLIYLPMNMRYYLSWLVCYGFHEKSLIWYKNCCFSVLYLNIFILGEVLDGMNLICFQELLFVSIIRDDFRAR